MYGEIYVASGKIEENHVVTPYLDHGCLVFCTGLWLRGNASPMVNNTNILFIV